MTHVELTAWLVTAYAAALLVVAHGIDLLSRRAQRTVQAQRAPGFRYHDDHDAWLCPEDQWLWPQSFDPDNRVMRYRGSPAVCNACPVKNTCTTSDDGREMRRAVDTWPASEAERFHRGIACVVSLLALAWPLAAVFTVHHWTSQVLLLGVAAGILLLSLPLWSHLRHTPADPHGVLMKSLDDNLAERRAAAETLARRRTTYASDRKDTSDRA